MGVVIAQVLIFLLMFVSAHVAAGLLEHKDMWPWICVYWILLTVKNAVDYLRTKYADKD